MMIGVIILPHLTNLRIKYNQLRTKMKFIADRESKKQINEYMHRELVALIYHISGVSDLSWALK